MLFQLKMVYQKEDIYALATAVTWGNSWSRNTMVLQKICAIFAGAMLLFAGGSGLLSSFFLLLTKGLSGYLGFYWVIPVLLSALLLFLGWLLICMRSSSIAGRISWKHYGLKDVELIYEFYEDYLMEHTPNSDYRANYTLIQYVAEDKDHYFLFTGKRSAFVLCKDDFLVGDSEEFGPWITGKVGKPIKKIY